MIHTMLLCTAFALCTAAPDDYLIAEVDALLDELGADDAPGLVVGIRLDDEVVYRRAIGLADVERGTANSTGTLFYIGSVAKQFTAACIARLLVEGKLSPDDDVRDLLPALADLPAAVSVSQLVQHRSGLRDLYEVCMIAGLPLSSIATNQSAVELIARQSGMNFEPGSDFGYSNSGYVLLAELVERVSGQTLDRYARKVLFDPAGMNSAAYRATAGAPPQGSARGHRPDDHGFRVVPRESGVVGPGGLFASVDDLLSWSSFLDEGLAAGDPLCELLHEPPRLTADARRDPRFADYSFGLMLDTHRELRRAQHAGGYPGWSSQIVRYPEERAAIVVLANSSGIDAAGLAKRIADIILRDRLGPAAALDEERRTGAEDRQLADGFYFNREHGSLWFIGGEGRFAKTSGLRFELAHEEGVAHSRTTAHPVELRLDPEGALLVSIAVAPPRRHRPLSMLDPAAGVQEFTGTFACLDADGAITFDSSGGRLILEQTGPGSGQPPFAALEGDLFCNDAGIVIEFERDAGGEIVGCEISSDRARRVRFLREE